jgi:hypothetical protein
VEVAAARFPLEAREIWLWRARAAFNAAILYGEAGHREGWKLATSDLAHVARLFPADGQIQEMANYFSLTFVEQLVKNF